MGLSRKSVRPCSRSMEGETAAWLGVIVALPVDEEGTGSIGIVTASGTGLG